ncbi:DivIVA domain-containing protein [Ilumatobacter sp.]|uniref:DivIVA domain-containing protein n=1 Tax=Ilumatobacter sp. TaxID=1967498 RepID=UPI003C4DCC92
MEISPHQVRNAEFKSAKRGLDPDEVRTFLDEVAVELERAQNQSTAMEARARAAVARLQEMTESGASTPVPTSEPDGSAPATEGVTASVDESETISRTLLLAQRTADTTMAEAKAAAERVEREATAEAAKTLETTRETSARMLDEAREEARRAGESERVTVKTEVDSLRARRDFLESDVEHLEQHLTEERSRLREAATTLLELTERVPGGLGEVRPPLLSASHDDTPTGIDEGAEQLDFARQGDGSNGGEGGDDTVGLVIQTDIADDEPDEGSQLT